jgi:hypothetical protein
MGCTSGDGPWAFADGFAASTAPNANERDHQFKSNTAELLRRAMWPQLLSQGRYTEAALWLKAIYGDGETTRSSEQTMARVYDFLPGIKRPPFVLR